MNNFLSMLILALFIGITFDGAAQITQANPSLFDLLEEQIDGEFMDLTIASDFQAVISTKSEDAGYFPATMTFEDQAGQDHEWRLKIKARGKFRRMQCDFPPLKLNFPKDDLAAAGLNDFDKYKLVTHCLDDPIKAKENLLKEYLAYRIYNLWSPYSFRVILLRIKYVDSSGELPNMRRYAFLIENKKELGERLGFSLQEDFLNPDADQFKPTAEINHSLFQYFIGNVDYNIYMGRNLELFQDNSTQLYIPIAYDFDFSGFVRPEYMTLNTAIGQTSATQRIYLGVAMNELQLRGNLLNIYKRKDEFLSLIHGFRLLPSHARKETLEYAETFFEELNTIQQNEHTPVYEQLRAFAPEAVPPGGNPEAYQPKSLMGK